MYGDMAIVERAVQTAVFVENLVRCLHCNENVEQIGSSSYARLVWCGGGSMSLGSTVSASFSEYNMECFIALRVSLFLSVSLNCAPLYASPTKRGVAN